MKQMPVIEKYMTAMPHTVNAEATIATAMKLMKDHRIRHLPVLEAGKLIGVLTDRDIKLASGLVGNEELKVDDVMTPDPFVAHPDSALDRIVFEMAEHKYGCAIVQQHNGKVVGIFTAVDGLRVLGEVLQSNFKPILQ